MFYNNDPENEPVKRIKSKRISLPLAETNAKAQVICTNPDCKQTSEISWCQQIAEFGQTLYKQGGLISAIRGEEWTPAPYTVTGVCRNCQTQLFLTLP